LQTACIRSCTGQGCGLLDSFGLFDFGVGKLCPYGLQCVDLILCRMGCQNAAAFGFRLLLVCNGFVVGIAQGLGDPLPVDRIRQVEVSLRCRIRWVLLSPRLFEKPPRAFICALAFPVCFGTFSHR